MLFRGTTEHPSATRLCRALDDVGAEANAATFSDMIILSLKVLPETLDAGLHLLKGMVTEPVFEGLTAERRIIIEECFEDMDEDGQVIALDQLSSQLLFGRHVYSLPILGPPENVERLTRAQLRTHLQTHFRPTQAVLVLSGGASPIEARTAATRVFGPWSSPTLPEPEAPIGHPPPFHGPRVLRIRSARSQVLCRLSFRGLSFYDPEYFVEKAIVRILDAASGSPLRELLQDKHGFCYSLGAGVDAYAQAGAVHVDLTLHPDRFLEGVDQLLRLFARLHRQGFTDEETRRMVAQYVKGKRLAANDLWDFSSRAAFRALYPGQLSFEDEFHATQHLTADRLNLLARRLFRASNLGLTLVGPIGEKTATLVRKRLQSFPD